MNILDMKNVVQLYVFSTLYVGYFLYVFDRRTFGFMIPIISEKDGLNRDAIGAVLSALATAYGIGKFVCGMMVDKLSPRVMFAAGLFGCGITNLLFSVSSSSWFAFLWFLNGLLQGLGWPACAKILRRWYSPKVFGSLWSILSTSMNIASSFGPLLCATYVTINDGQWRPVMHICGTISCSYALATLLILKNKPEKNSLSVEESSDDPKKPDANEQDKMSAKVSLSTASAMVAIFSSFYTYVVSFGFMVSLFIKGVLSDWIALYLNQDKNANPFVSGTFLAWMEVGGVIGSIFSGYVSDKLVEYVGPQSKGHPRHYMYITWSIVTLVCLRAFQNVEDVNQDLSIVLIIAFALGFTVYGNISLSGVLAIENSAEDISGTAHACCALFGNVGLTFSGLPFSKLVGYVGWNNAINFCKMLLLLLTAVFILAQKRSCRIGAKKKDE